MLRPFFFVFFLFRSKKIKKSVLKRKRSTKRRDRTKRKGRVMHTGCTYVHEVDNGSHVVMDGFGRKTKELVSHARRFPKVRGGGGGGGKLKKTGKEKNLCFTHDTLLTV